MDTQVNTEAWIKTWIKEHILNVVPMTIAVIDQSFNLVYANKSFEQMFGAWRNQKCYFVYKSQDSLCSECKGMQAFKDGVQRSNEEVGYNSDGKLIHYIKHTIPIIDDDGNIPFLLEMATDITEIEKMRKERQLLFDQVPCSVVLIDKDYKIVRTNKRNRKMFGDIVGQYCFKTFKELDKQCTDCTAMKTFADGKTHSGYSEVINKNGDTVQFHVTTVPLNISEGKVDLVLEMAVDITQTLKLEDELKIAHAYMESMVTSSMDGIIGMDSNKEITIFNDAARKTFNMIGSAQVTLSELDYLLPDGFLDQISIGPGHVHFPATHIETVDGKSVPVRLTGFQIIVDDKSIGMAIFIQDLREIKQLEKEKIEAERLATVGQTVAGLAHGVKNLITSLEGGMYMLNSGMKNSKVDRIQDGMEMLDRNINRISTFVREFLSFSKGRNIRTELCKPGNVAQEVVGMYETKARTLGVDLKFSMIKDVNAAHMDYEGMHESLTNLVGNAIDACLLSDNKKNTIWVRVSEEDEVIIFEVEDNGCGMDYDVKKKVFTNFFTTKGLGGTGLGLLTTKKIVQEHGGKVKMISQKGEGTTLRIELPRNRLPKQTNEQ